MADFNEPNAVWRWLAQQPDSISVPVVARLVLRTLPLIIIYQRSAPGRAFFETRALPSFRASAVAWAAACAPNPKPGLRSAALAGARQVRKGYVSAGISNDDALANAYQAAMVVGTGRMDFDLPAFGDKRGSPFHAYADAYGYAARATAEDVAAIDSSSDPEQRAQLTLWQLRQPIWGVSIPAVIGTSWARLKTVLYAQDEGWEVWIRWYEDRLFNGPSLGDDFDFALATLPDALWDEGPKTVNARIKELIAEHTPADSIPAQGAGPHFALNSDLKIGLAPAADFDGEGNNLGRIASLLPVVRQAASDLAGHVSPNSQPELGRNLAQYREAIAGEPETIAWGTVFGLGVRLENVSSAARREIANRLQEPLEDAAQEALDSVLTLHGPLILATAEGRELSELADQFRMTRDEQAALRAAAQTVAEALKTANLAEPAAARLTEEAAETIGEGPHPERGSVFGLATIKNVATVLVPSAVLGVLAAAIGGGTGVGIFAGGFHAFRQSKRFDDAAKALGGGLDRVLFTLDDQAELVKAQAEARLRLLVPFRDFVARNEQPLRQIAENSTQLRWALRYIDLIVRSNGQ